MQERGGLSRHNEKKGTVIRKNYVWDQVSHELWVLRERKDSYALLG